MRYPLRFFQPERCPAFRADLDFYYRLVVPRTLGPKVPLSAFEGHGGTDESPMSSDLRPYRRGVDSGWDRCC